MTDYVKAVNFAAKDDLPSGDTNKIIRGTEINTEYTNIATAVATKANSASPALTGTVSLNGTAITSTAAELNILDGVTSTAAELNILDGVTATTAELNKTDGLTATTTELNYVDGVTSAIQTQLNTKANSASPVLTGLLRLNGAALTATFAELNALDGITASVGELNILDGLTATTTELNYVDGVTSAIQTQLNTKAPIASPTFTGIATAANLTATGTVTFDGIAFADGAPSNSLVVNAAGNVGIGTSSPSSKLEVAGDQLFVSGAGTTLGIQIKGEQLTAIPGAQNAGYLATGSSAIGDAGDLLIAPRTSTTCSIRFLTGTTGSTERMRIDSSGNVGIGTSSPSEALTVQDAAPSILVRTDASANQQVKLGWSGGDGRLTFGNNTVYGGLRLFAYDGTNSIERMRIDPAGRVLIGKSAGNSGAVGVEAHSGGIIYATASGGHLLQLNRLASDGDVVIFRRENITVGSVSVTATATAYNTSSDYRLKENVTPMTGAADRVLALKPSRFNFTVDPTKVVDGFIAHEAQEVVPEAVTGTKDAMTTEEYEVTPAVYETVVTPAEYDEDGVEITPESTEEVLVTAAVMGEREAPAYQAIDQSKLVPLLTAALQEALTRIAALEAAQ